MIVLHKCHACQNVVHLRAEGTKTLSWNPGWQDRERVQCSAASTHFNKTSRNLGEESKININGSGYTMHALNNSSV